MRAFTRLLCAAAAVLGLPAAARAADVRSSNWSGYAIHRAGVSFSSVSAQWTEPSASCSGQPGFSSFWVGLGGYSKTASALEQIGSEVDCQASGMARSSAWYELVPAPTRTISLRISPGDVLRGSVSAAGHRVTLALSDLTSGRAFRKAVYLRHLDLSSAEWIAEAPSACDGATNCQTLPLANFGQATFSHAAARAVSGRSGSISYHGWGWSRIRLRPTSMRFIEQGGGSAGAEATPSSLQSGGSRFTVIYSPLAPQASVRRSVLARAAAGEIVH